MTSRRSSGSIRADSAVEPTRSENITVTWRRSAVSWCFDAVSVDCGGAWAELQSSVDELGSATKLLCPPENTNNLKRVRLIVAYIEARPERMKDGFGLLANEAMAKAWPCQMSCNSPTGLSITMGMYCSVCNPLVCLLLTKEFPQR
jgi:Rap1a immunity proteins